MRFFEKISYEQFKRDIKEDMELYNNYLIPKRATTGSAGYDFYMIDDFVLKPNEIITIPTGIKAKMNIDEVLYIVVRSSTGFKYNVRMVNQIGVIDSDYYNNENNEGHIFFKIQNQGDKEFRVLKNQPVVQGIFSKFLMVEDDDILEIRKGGIGSS